MTETARSCWRVALIIVAVLMALIVPWDHTYAREGASLMNWPAGYGPIFAPPEKMGGGMRVDFGRLAAQWLAFAAVAWLSLGRRAGER